MGNCFNAEKKAKKKILLQVFRHNERLMANMKSIGLEEYQLFELYLTFSAMDKDHSGEISIVEFFEYVDLPRTRFTEKAFTVMDKDGSGQVDFVEFVLAVWNYCTFNRSSLMRYAFDLYDIDGSGNMELFEVVRCVREVWGAKWEQNENAQKIVHKLEVLINEQTQDRSLSYHMFEDFARRHPLLLFPAFQLQTDLQTAVLGEKFWVEAAKCRVKMSKGTGVLQWKHVEEMFQSSTVLSENVVREVEEKRLDDLVENKIRKKTMGQEEEEEEKKKEQLESIKTMKTSKSMSKMKTTSTTASSTMKKSSSSIELKYKPTSSTSTTVVKNKQNNTKTSTSMSTTVGTTPKTAIVEEETMVQPFETPTPTSPSSKERTKTKPASPTSKQRSTLENKTASPPSVPSSSNLTDTKTKSKTLSSTPSVLTKKPSGEVESSSNKLILEDLVEEQDFTRREAVSRPLSKTVSSTKAKSNQR